MRLIQLLVLCALAASPPAWSGSKKTPPRYPSQLHGFWIPEAASCPRAGESFEGDSALQIGPRMIQGYEDRSKPTSVVLISSKPLAWRIESLMDAGPSGVYTKDQPRIFVVGEQRITVVSSSHAETYRRCADQRTERHPITADNPEKFEGEWSYRSDCDQGHYVTLKLENKNDLLIGAWSDGTQLHGSQGLLKGHMKQGRLVAEWCSESEQAGSPALCPTYKDSDDYLVARDGTLVWYQKYGQDYVEYVVLKQGSESQPMEACDEDK